MLTNLLRVLLLTGASSQTRVCSDQTLYVSWTFHFLRHSKEPSLAESDTRILSFSRKSLNPTSPSAMTPGKQLTPAVILPQYTLNYYNWLWRQWTQIKASHCTDCGQMRTVKYKKGDMVINSTCRYYVYSHSQHNA